MAALALVGMIPLMIAIGAFAVDIMHINAVQSELQKACDAGALAGAQDLWEYSTLPGNPPARALTVTGLNLADGQFVSSLSPNTTVTATVTTVPTNSTGGEVQVVASMGVDNIFAKIIGQPVVTVTCQAKAGQSGKVKRAAVGETFPIAISVDAVGVDGSQLWQHVQGDTITMEWHTNVCWTAFTSHNASAVGNCISDYKHPETGTVPSVTVGTAVDCTNGVQASNLASMSSMIGKVINLPVITGTSFNANNNVVGFVSLKVTGVTGSGAGTQVTGTLVNSMINGESGYTASTGTGSWDSFLNTNESALVKLLN